MTPKDIYRQLLDGSREFWPWAFWVGNEKQERAEAVLSFLKRELCISFEHLTKNMDGLKLGAMFTFVFGCSFESLQQMWEAL